MSNVIRVGLVGHGRAGQAVARILAQAEDVDLRWIVRRGEPDEVERLSSPAPIHPASRLSGGELLDADPVDAIVDFAGPNAIHVYGEPAARRGVCIVCAVSHLPDTTRTLLRRLAMRTVVMSSPNITFGINYLLVASQLLQQIAPFADIEVIEEHFRDKAERSGTALRIAQSLGLDDSKINSIRVGGIVGHHEVVFGFPYQTVRLVHDSIGREAFGNGALFALRKLQHRSPGLYSFEDLLRESMLHALGGRAPAPAEAAETVVYQG